MSRVVRKETLNKYTSLGQISDLEIELLSSYILSFTLSLDSKHLLSYLLRLNEHLFFTYLLDQSSCLLI